MLIKELMEKRTMKILQSRQYPFVIVINK